MLEVRGLTPRELGEAAAEGRGRDWDEVITR
jgi:hypothetical protein